MIYKKIKYFLLKKQIEKKSDLSNKELGQKGEEFAVLTLELKGYKVIGKNLRVGGGEIDILAVKNDSLYVFEVKLRTSDEFGEAVDAITGKKKRKLIKITESLDKKRYKTIHLNLFVIDIKFGKLYYDIVDISK